MQRPRRARFVRPQLEELEQRAVPAVLTPVQVRHAYGFDQVLFTANGKSIAADGSGQTIAIINAYNDTNIVGDLDTFDKAFSVNGKQTLYQQYGVASSFLTIARPQGTPQADPSGGLWNLETALDVEWAHAIAPGAKILLVQARTNSMLDLLGAVDYARSQPGVVAVSMSWGANEFVGETYYDSHFATPAGHLGGSNGVWGAKLAGGVTFVAAAGDKGAPGLWPALSPYVVGVGGTSLTVTAAGNYMGETAWSGSGGGVSTQEKRPAYQNGAVTGTMLSGPDVAYNGDPNTGVYVYDSMPISGRKGGWWQVGGTSAGTPQWAALIAIADQGRALQGKGSLDGFSQTLPTLYAAPSSDFHDVTKGSNGYSARAGFDLVTGRGTPVAQNLVADLIRAGTQTSTAAKTGTASATNPSGVKPSLFFVGIGSADGTMTFGASGLATALAPAENTLTRPTASVVEVTHRSNSTPRRDDAVTRYAPWCETGPLSAAADELAGQMLEMAVPGSDPGSEDWAEREAFFAGQ